MSGGVGGEAGETNLLGHGSEGLVVGRQAVLVFGKASGATGADDGEHVEGAGAAPSVENILNARLDPDGERVAGLVSAVVNVAVANVIVLEVGHIDERHASGRKAEQEHVAPQSLAPVKRQVSQLNQDTLRQCALTCRLHPRKRILKNARVAP